MISVPETWDLRPVTWNPKLLDSETTPMEMAQNCTKTYLHFVKKQYLKQMMSCSDWMTIQLTGKSIYYTIHKQHTHLTLKMASKTLIENDSHNYYVLFKTTLTGTKIPSS